MTNNTINKINAALWKSMHENFASCLLHHEANQSDLANFYFGATFNAFQLLAQVDGDVTVELDAFKHLLERNYGADHVEAIFKAYNNVDVIDWFLDHEQ